MTQPPSAILRHRKKGTVIKKIRDNYYLYKAKSVWDPNRRRARMVTERYLGRVTEDGLVKPKYERAIEAMGDITVKEFGGTDFLLSTSSDVIGRLKESYPTEWKEISVLAATRLFHASPLKNVMHYYATSHLSDVFPDAGVSPRHLGDLLSSLGARRGKMVEFMKGFVIGNEFMAMDLTHVFSLSEDVISATLGHNSDEEYVPQVNIALVFSIDKMQPSFFRMVAGSISGVSTVVMSLRESGVSRAVMVGDKGLYSERNAREAEKNGLEYIFPLKRNNSLIDYGVIRSGDEKRFDGYFMFNRRVIWYSQRDLESGEFPRRTTKVDDDGRKEEAEAEMTRRRVIIFLDEKLKTEEKKDFLTHVEAGEKRMKEYFEYQDKFGTITVITNSNFHPKRVFELLKSRVNIEQLFDMFRNLLHADRSYMRDDEHLEGWMFVNFVAMLMYYRIYGVLLRKGLLKRYSPNDVMVHLSRVHKVRVAGRWMLAEVPKTSRIILRSIGIKPHIT